MKTVNNKEYKLVTGPGEFKCDGCVADFSRYLCDLLPCTISTIWVPAAEQPDLKN